MLYRLHCCCTCWTPPPDMVTHLSAKQSEDGHPQFPLAFFLCSAVPVVLGRGAEEEGRRLCFLSTYFNPSGMDSGEWRRLFLWRWGSRLLSPSSPPPCLTHPSKWSDQGCPTVLSCSSTAPQHHGPTMNETTNSTVCGNQLHCEVCGHSKQLPLHRF